MYIKIVSSSEVSITNNWSAQFQCLEKDDNAYTRLFSKDKLDLISTSIDKYLSTKSVNNFGISIALANKLKEYVIGARDVSTFDIYEKPQIAVVLSHLIKQSIPDLVKKIEDHKQIVANLELILSRIAKLIKM